MKKKVTTTELDIEFTPHVYIIYDILHSSMVMSVHKTYEGAKHELDYLNEGSDRLEYLILEYELSN